MRPMNFASRANQKRSSELIYVSLFTKSNSVPYGPAKPSYQACFWILVKNPISFELTEILSPGKSHRFVYPQARIYKHSVRPKSSPLAEGLDSLWFTTTDNYDIFILSSKFLSGYRLSQLSDLITTHKS